MDYFAEYCEFCDKEIAGTEYDQDSGMCFPCLSRLRVQFKHSDDKKPLGKMKSLKKYE